MSAVHRTTVAPATCSRRKPSASKVAFLVHSVTGLWLTILLSIVLLTGTITVLYAELDWLIYPQMRTTPAAQRVNPGALYDAAVAAYPNAGIDFVATGATTNYRAAQAFAAVAGGGFRMIWIDQFSGQVIGDTPFLTIGQFINLLHTTLFLPVVGRYVVNFFGVMLLISITTGLIVYKKFWRGFFRHPRFDRNARTWLGDLHRLIALWSVWFLLIIGGTGTWWFYANPLVEPGGAPALVSERPEPPTISTAVLDTLGPEAPQPHSGAEIVAAVQAAYPDMRITHLQPPANAAQPFVVRGDRGELLVNGGANAVYVNPYTADIMDVRLSEDWSTSQRIDAAMHPLHYGTWAKHGAADLAVKLVWFAGGLLTSFLALSGLVIYLRRTRHAATDILANSRLAGRLRQIWRWVRPWGGSMGALKYVNVLGAIGIVSGAVLVISIGSEGISDKGKRYPMQTAGPFEVTPVVLAGFLEAELDPIRPGATVGVFPQISDGRFQDARFIRVGVTDASGTETANVLVEGAEGIAHADVQLPQSLGGAQLWIELEGWDSRKHRTQWSLLADAR